MSLNMDLKVIFDLRNVKTLAQENVEGLGSMMTDIIEANGDLTIYAEDEKVKNAILAFEENLKIRQGE